MTIQELVAIINEMNIPFAYDHFAEGKVQIHPLSVIYFLRIIILVLMGKCINRF
ncbi:hypothetical protein P261_02621 [Lachnospiraceae bacterium TWA4]|nr:hypothetical protein P261_02621 [Lachnospiraceae bacterium TWA4]